MTKTSHSKEYFKGLIIATLGVIVLSFDALLIRLAGVAGFKAGFWRALFTGLSLTILFFTTNRKNSFKILKEGGLPMWVSATLWGCSGLIFTLGVMTAGASTILIMLSLAPLCAAAFSFFAYKQKVSWVTLLAAVGAIGGIWYMYRNGVGHLTASAIVFALLTPTLLGINLSFMRRHKEMSRVGLSMLGGYIGAFISLIIAKFNVGVPKESIIYLLVLGAAAIPFAQTMISTGTRYIPAAESALINSLETVLGITYVWIFLGEIPNANFMFGGAIVLLSITANSLYQARVKKAQDLQEK